MAIASIAQPDTKRDAAAAQLVKTAHTWPVVTLKQAFGAFPAGTTFRAVPGSSGKTYLANAVVCECPDYQRSHNVCKHVRALILAQAPAPKPAPRKKTYSELFPED